MRKAIIITILLISSITLSVNAQNRASWMKDAKWGVMLHYSAAILASENKLDADSINIDKWNHLIDNFDCEELAKQLSDVGAGYLIITIRHVGGFFMAPNSMYEHYMGQAPSISSNRDLIVDLHQALDQYGIKLITYVSSKFRFNPEEVKAFAYDSDDPRKAEMYLRWQEVIREFSTRWGDKVSGWWIDGCYTPNSHFRHPDIPNFASMAAAARAGNPNSSVAFNPGVFPRVMSLTPYEDYTAGEINDPSGIRWKYNEDGMIDGNQIQILSYLGKTWGEGDPRFTAEQVIKYSLDVNEKGGAVTWDVPPLRNGTISDDFMKQLGKIGDALGTKKK
ncbi:alpha-L-fucosidase [Pleomorphovibrio marinus]|uniref:alpha-L-fucosidase n=1 Tax=Pleomorphovibrio marinus TaxID=2164132 RepID=UPI000E09FE22|nr:alpha-L-fucosidase [Pleomorphovibrio marinus]